MIIIQKLSLIATNHHQQIHQNVGHRHNQDRRSSLAHPHHPPRLLQRLRGRPPQVLHPPDRHPQEAPPGSDLLPPDDLGPPLGQPQAAVVQGWQLLQAPHQGTGEPESGRHHQLPAVQHGQARELHQDGHLRRPEADRTQLRLQVLRRRQDLRRRKLV
jgi:hypothetical protein